ncbi:MAG TPA: hypothetical protein VK184_03555 [Nostocaceae cyanobacterium]|nr:hypothetical protein [Nostocaceae cyanobacterium]
MDTPIRKLEELINETEGRAGDLHSPTKKVSFSQELNTKGWMDNL